MTFMVFLLMLGHLSAEDTFSVKLGLSKQGSLDSRIVVTITNNSKNDLKVLKWDTVLENQLSADIFTVSSGKAKMRYLGRIFKRGMPKEEDYIVFKAGEKRTVEIKLSNYYEMKSKGEYLISHNSEFIIKDDKHYHHKQHKYHLSEAKFSTENIYISFTPSAEEESIRDQKVAPAFNGCTESQKTLLNAAQDEAMLMATNARETMNSAGENTIGQRYITWFGTATPTRQNSVTSHFNSIYSALDTKQVNYDCSCNEDYYAYVYPSEPYFIYLCNAFWPASMTGTDSKAGTIIHELSHFTILGGTHDHAYGHTDAKALAINSPDQAVFNADNHEYFAENTPFLDMSVVAGAKALGEIDGNLTELGSIDSGGEVDKYHFTVLKTGQYTLYTTGGTDTFGSLYDSQVNLLAENDDEDYENAKYNFKFTSTLYKGTSYYLFVRGYDANTIGSYTLRVEAKALDSDNDGIYDARERELNLNVDSNDSDNDGILDLVEVVNVETPQDTDNDGIIDALDEDSDNDGFLDRDEVVAGTSPTDENDYPSLLMTNEEKALFLIFLNRNAKLNEPSRIDYGIPLPLMIEALKQKSE